MQEWHKVAESNLIVLTDKYDLAKKPLRRDKARIERHDKEIKTLKNESMRLSKAPSNKCIELENAENKAKELIKEQAVTGKELKVVQEEREKYLNEIVMLAIDLDLVCVYLKAKQEAKENLVTEKERLSLELEKLKESYSTLSKDKKALEDKNAALIEQLNEKTTLIDNFNDLIDAMYYNTWRSKGLSWFDDYTLILLLIRKIEVKEDREEAKSRDESFDKDMFILTTFSEEERKLQNQSMLEEEYKSSSRISWLE